MSDEEVVGTAVIRVVIDRTGNSEEIDQAVKDAEARLKAGGDRGGAAYGDSFGRQVRTRVAAAVRNLPDAKLNLDDTEANRKLIEIRATMVGMSETRLGIKLSDEEVYANLQVLKADLEALTHDRNIRVRVDAAAALAEIEALNAALNGVGPKTAKVVAEGEKDFGLLRNAIEQLLPPLVVFGGGLIGVSSSLVGFGTAGILAIKGVSAEMKSGSAIGQQYNAGIGTLKIGLGQLEKTAAAGVLTGFQGAVAKVSADLPAFNSEVAVSSKNLGDLTNHLVGGLVGGFLTFSPLIHEAETDVDKLAAKFEVWATGPGGTKFMETLTTDMREAGPAIASVAEAGSHLISALQPVGGTIVTEIKAFTDVIKAIPVPILQAAATAYLAFRTATLVTAGIELAAKSILKLAGAQTVEAAAATKAAAANTLGAEATLANGAAATGSATRIGATATFLTAKVLPFAAAYVAGTFALNSFSKELGDTAHQMSTTKAVLQGGLNFDKDLLTLNFGHLGADLDLPKVQQQFATDIKNMKAEIAANIGGPINVDLAIKAVANEGDTSNDNGVFTKAAAQVIEQYHSSASEIAIAIGAAKVTLTTAQKDYASDLAGTGDSSRAGINDAKNTLDSARTDLKNLMDAQGQLNADLQAAGRVRIAFNKSVADYAAKVQVPITNAQTAAFKEPTYAAAATDLTTLATSAQQAADKLAEYNKVQLGANGAVGGGKEALAEYQKVVAQFGGDAGAATLFIAKEQAAFGQYTAAVTLSSTENAKLNGVVQNTAGALHLTTAQVDLYGNAMGDTAAKLIDGSVSQQQFTADVKVAEKAINDGSVVLTDFVGSLQTFNSSLDTVGARATLMEHAFIDLQGGALGYANTVLAAASADQQLVQAFQANHKGAIDLKTGLLDLKNAAAVPIAGALQQLQGAAAAAAAATYQFEYHTLGAKKATQDANAVFRNDTYNALIAQHKQLGLTADEAKRLADNYFSMPADATTDITAIGMDQVAGTLKDILADLDAVDGNHHVTLDVALSSGSYSVLQQLSAAEASTRNRIGTVSANGNIFNAYANGGMRENHVAQIAQSGRDQTRVWNEPETGGEGYVPFAMSKRSRSQAITKQIANRLGGAAYFSEGGASTAGGFSGGFDTTNFSTSSKSGSSNQLTVSDLDAFLKALPGTLAEVQAAEVTLAKAVKDAGGSNSLAAYLKKEDVKLNAEVKYRNGLADELAKAQTHYTAVLQEYHNVETNVSGALKGAFDISTAGTPVTGGAVTFNSIYAQEKQAANKVTLLVSGLKKLKAEGLNGDYVEQLAAKGVDALPEVTALLAATPKQLGLLNATANTINTQANTGAYIAATAQYGAALLTARDLITGIGSDKAMAGAVTALATQLFGAGKFVTAGLTKGIASQKAAAVKEAGEIADAIVAEIKSHLKVKSPSEVTADIGANVSLGLSLGMASKLDHVRNTSNKLAGAAIPSMTGGSASQSAPRGTGTGDQYVTMGQLMALIDAMSNRPVVLTANGNQLAIAVGEQNQRLARLG